MQKLADWKKKAHLAPRVQLSRAVDVTTPPSSRRASFPYNSLPPWRVLTAEDVLRELVDVPNITETGVWCWILGAVAGAVLNSSIRWGRKAALLASIVALLIRILQFRQAKAVAVSRLENVSSTPAGPCHVTTRVLSITNSHAGTHADTPFHFLPTDERQFDHAQYNGDALLIDVSRAIASQPNKTITEQVLQDVTKRLDIDWSNVWRVLFCTRTLDSEEVKRSNEWQSTFAHFSADAAEFLARQGTRLLLVGIDTPSIDHHTAAPIRDYSHGTFHNADIAILENLDFVHLRMLSLPDATHPAVATTPTQPNVGMEDPTIGERKVVGHVQTIFSEPQAFPDAKGCTVFFYPTDGEL